VKAKVVRWSEGEGRDLSDLEKAGEFTLLCIRKSARAARG
jgi:hypothetical protein